MLGDWAQFGSHRFKVRELSDKQINLYTPDCDIKPVPLSLELLNGLFPWRGTHHRVEDKNYYLTIDQCRHGYWKVEIVKRGEHRHTDRISKFIRYVHELQHILRLFDMDIEINELVEVSFVPKDK